MPRDPPRCPGRYDILRADFDQAINTFGRWVEAKLQETHGDKNRTPKYSMRFLMADPVIREGRVMHPLPANIRQRIVYEK